MSPSQPCCRALLVEEMEKEEEDENEIVFSINVTKGNMREVGKRSWYVMWMERTWLLRLEVLTRN